MPAISTSRSAELRRDFEKVLHILENSDGIDPKLSVPGDEFKRRQAATWHALNEAGLDVGFVLPR